MGNYPGSTLFAREWKLRKSNVGSVGSSLTKPQTVSDEERRLSISPVRSARSALRYRSPTVTGTRRWTNGAARDRRLVERDAINEDKFIREVDRPAAQKSDHAADRRRDNCQSRVAKSIAGADRPK